MSNVETYKALREFYVSENKRDISEDFTPKELRELAIAKYRTMPHLTFGDLINESGIEAMERITGSNINDFNHMTLVQDIIVDAFKVECHLWETLQSDLDIAINDIECGRLENEAAEGNKLAENMLVDNIVGLTL